MTDPLLRRALRWTAVLVAPVVLTIAATHELAYNAAPPGQWLLVLALVWVLVLRRRAPVLVFAVDLVILLALLALDVESVGALGLLVAIYTVAAHRDVRFAIGSAVALELLVLLFAVRFAPSGSIGDAVAVLSGLAAGALFLGTTFRAQRRYLASVEDRAVRVEREQAQLAELAAADERARIAREMHDIVAHGLAVVITLAEGAAEATPAEAGPGREAMKQVAAAGRQSLGEMRGLLGVLRTESSADRLPQPDVAAIDQLVGEVRLTGLDVRYRRSDACLALGATVQATLYRLVQESLTNVIKHAPSAEVVTVELDCDETSASFSVTDDGGGRARVAADRSGRGGATGNGIAGMRERAAMFDGQLEAAAIEGGWRVRGTLRAR